MCSVLLIKVFPHNFVNSFNFGTCVDKVSKTSFLFRDSSVDSKGKFT